MIRRRRLPFAACALAALSLCAACERSTQALLRRFAAADSGAALYFPRQRTGLRTAPLMLADSRIAACEPLPADTAQWRVNILPTQLGDVSWITMRTPFRLPPSIAGVPGATRIRADTTTVRRLLGSWAVPRTPSPLPGDEEQSLALWLGAVRYPTEALPVGTHQPTLAECASLAENRPLYLARYSVIWLSGDTTHHLAAYLPLSGDTALTALGRALTPALRDELAAALRTIRLFHRTP